MRAKTLFAMTAAMLLQGLLLPGCGSGSSEAPPASVATGSSVQLASAGQPDTPISKGRAQLWAENCPRCHNARPATFYTLREWDVAMHHMRVRCSLTAEEHRKIMEFFKASK
jgi:hypothetical protein